jgi:hypothetical protein
VTPQTKNDQTEFSIHLPQEYSPGLSCLHHLHSSIHLCCPFFLSLPPKTGTHDQYNQMAYQTLQQVFETATGTQIQDASQKELYGPMQFESKTYWQTEGFFTGVPQKHPLVYGGVTTRLELWIVFVGRVESRCG